jgi:hypothetical protein
MTTTLTVTADTTYNRVNLNIASTLPYAQVQRSLDGGASWSAYVRGDVAWNLIAVTGGARRVPDAEAPFDMSLLYRAQGTNNAGTVDPWTAPVAVTLPHPPGGDWVLSPITSPGYQLVSWIRSQEGYQRAIAMGIFYALGRSDPIVTAGVRQTATGKLLLYAGDQATRTKIEDALTAYVVFVVRSPAGHGWGTRYVALGEVAFNRIVNRPVEAWDVELDWWEVLSPQVPVSRYLVTYYDVRTHYATYADVKDAYSSYDALKNAVF